MPSSCLRPAISPTAAVMTTPTSWRICFCKRLYFIFFFKDGCMTRFSTAQFKVTVFIVCVVLKQMFSLLLLLIRYVVSSLELLVAEDYMIVYLNGATPRRKMPGISWLKRCYQMIDRK